MSDDPLVLPDDQSALARAASEQGSDVLRVDRLHAVHISGDAAREMSDTLGRASREGLRLTRAARPGDIFEVVPPKHLAEGIKNGTLRAANPQSGDASVLVMNVKTG